MTISRSPARVARQLAVSVTAVALAATVLGSSPAAVARSGDAPGELPGYVAPAPPKVEKPSPLPVRSGTVPVRTTTKTWTSTTQRLGAAATIVPSTKKVALRALVIGLDEDDWGVDTWTSTLDRLGAGYDVLHSSSDALTRSRLVAADGTGRYNAVLLTDAMQAYIDPVSGFTSAFTTGADGEWNTLWAYEREFGVRQAALYASYGAWPEDYCLRPFSEGGVGASALQAQLTAEGASLFDYLKPTAQIPIADSYVYKDRLDTGTDNPDCAGAEAILRDGDDVLGVRSTSSDGRDRMALTFTSNQYLLQANLLAYGMFRWASRGMYFGEQRHYLEVDVDDWFNTSDHVLPQDSTSGATAPLYGPEFSMVPGDVSAASAEQKKLATEFPLASAFKLNIAYNGGDVEPVSRTCTANLTSMSRCLRDEFRWINHTLTHPKMNFIDYATSRLEIDQNLRVAKGLGLKVPKSVLKTGEYSGLGVYHPDPTNDIDPPTDNGLMASNPELLRAAKDSGVKFLHGNMSFVSHQPSCFNCGVIHPMEKSLTIVPDWPTNLAYFSTTPDEETWFYNWFYGPNGKFSFFPEDQTYSQLLENEASQALQHVTTGSIYSHTLHIGNLYDYDGSGPGTNSLAFDWIRATVAKYSALYRVPLLSPTWEELAKYVADRNRHFTAVESGVAGVYDPVTKRVTLTSPATHKFTLSGLKPSSSTTTYGTDVSGALTVKRKEIKVVDMSPLP